MFDLFKEIEEQRRREILLKEIEQGVEDMYAFRNSPDTVGAEAIHAGKLLKKLEEVTNGCTNGELRRNAE